MKHLITQALISLTVLLCSYFNVFAGESGWEQRPGYKYQKLLFKDLVSLHLSPNSDSIFTYNKDGLFRIWNFESGVLLDSVDFKDSITHLTPDLFQFSDDGQTIITSHFVSYTEGGHFDANPNGLYPTGQRIKIFDINSKKVIVESTITLNNLFSFKQQNEGKFSYLSASYNYVSTKRQLYVRTYFGIGGIGFLGTYEYITGYLGIVEPKDDSLIPKKQINDIYVTDYLQYTENVILCSNYNSYQYNSVSESHSKSEYWSLYSLKKFDLSNDSSSNLIYNHFSSQPETIGKGIFRIFPTSMSDTILYRSNFSYHYYDLELKSDIASRSISFPYGNSYNYKVIDAIYDTKDVLVMYQDLMYYFNNLHTSNRIDSIVSPIAIDLFFIAKNNKSLIAYNSAGEIVVIPIGHITAVVESKVAMQSHSISIYPNPTATKFTVSGLDRVSSISIVNSLGMEVSQQQVVTPQVHFDANGFSNGVYFVKFRTSTGLVSKMFVVYR